MIRALLRRSALLLAVFGVGGCGRALGLDELTFDRAAGGSGSTETPECKTHADCNEAYLGPHICRASRCVSLTNYDPTIENEDERGDCKVVIGDDNLSQGVEPLLFGVLASVNPLTPGSSPPVLNYKLVVQEFSTHGGIPLAGVGHLPVGVVCRNDVSPERLMRSLDFMVDDLGISGVIAGISDANVLKNSFEHLRQKNQNIFFVNPFSASSVVTSLQNEDLIWHMLPDTREIAPTYFPLVQRIERYLAPPAPMRVALVVASDYVKLADLGQAVADGLRFNGKTAEENGDAFLRVNWRSWYTDPKADLSTSLALLQAFKPHLIVSAAGPELLTKIISNLERDWPVTEQARPFYLLTPQQAAAHADLQQVLRENRDYELYRRVVGVNNAAAADPTLYNEYFANLSSEFPGAPSIAGTENYYDAAYFLFYAAGAGAVDQQLRGLDYARGMRRLLGGVPYRVGSRDIISAFGYLQDDRTRTIALQGTLGPPEFHANGARIGVGSVWCMAQVADPKVSGNPWEYRYDVLRYDPETSDLTGTFPCFDGF